MKTSKVFLDKTANIAIWTKVEDGYVIETLDYSIKLNFEALSKFFGLKPIFIEIGMIENLLTIIGYEYLGEL